MDYEYIRHSTDSDRINEYTSFLSGPFVSSSKYYRAEKTTARYLSWQYAENPAGKVLGYSAYYRGQIAGHFSTLPVSYLINGEKSRGLLALNLVTHPDHRGKGLFLAMCNRTFEDAFNEGYRFVVGVANQNSTHGLVKRLGFDLVSPLDVRIGFGNLHIDKESGYSLRSSWDSRSIQWRLSNPSASYMLNSGKFIVAKTGKLNINAQIYEAEEPDESFKVLKTSVNPLRVWIGLGRFKGSDLSHLPVPGQMKPVPLNFIFKDLRGSSLKFDKKDVLLELIDFDAY